MKKYIIGLVLVAMFAVPTVSFADEKDDLILLLTQQIATLTA